MSQLAPIFNALRLPISDVDALSQGQTIAAMPQTFLRPGQQFGLYPDNPNLDAGNVLVKAWARCELCQPIDSPKALDIISRLTVWSAEALQSILVQRGSLWLAYLRVYLLPSPVEVLIKTTGQFIPLTHPITVTNDAPVVSDRAFAKRRERLEKLELPEEPELESLEIAISQLAITNPIAKLLDEQIQVYLGWAENSELLHSNDDIEWISRIADVGNSSDGYEFEKLTRRGFQKLGFTGNGLDSQSTGGAGGMDLYADYPYPIIGECKATKTETVSDGTPAQLLKIGMNHLGKDRYERSVKLIIAAGELNSFAQRTARENQMNVISPETLQKLVDLKAKCDGSVNLWEIKRVLENPPFGKEADDKVNSYISRVYQDLVLRSHIIQSVKELMNQPGEDYLNASAVRVQYNATFGKDSNPKLDDRGVHDLLVELSSPLAGYLGREKSNSNWRGDRFYFLRDLPCDAFS